MNNEDEPILVEFHNRSKQIFFSVYHAFEGGVSKLNRTTGEAKFQQLKKQYIAVLEQELRVIAQNVLAQHKNAKRLSEIDPMLHQFIRDYLHRFVQKANSI